MNEQNQIFFKKNDFIFITILGLIGLLIWCAHSWLISDSGEYIIKSYSNGIESEQMVTLDSNRMLKVKGKEGDMLIEIEENKGIRVASSSCRCQICVNSGWSKSESLICIPNNVLITPKKKRNDDSSVDAITR